jgi:hypothetical protein
MEHLRWTFIGSVLFSACTLFKRKLAYRHAIGHSWLRNYDKVTVYVTVSQPFH